MELNQALKIVLEMAAQNMPDDVKQQMDAVENVRLHLQELENPSPIQVVLITEGGVIHESISNVPIEVTVLDGDLDGAESGDARLFPSEGDAEYLVYGHGTSCDPARVATLVAEATN